MLESKLTGVRQPSSVCSTDHGWEVEWVTPGTAALVPCLLNNLIVNYNITTGMYQNQTGDSPDAHAVAAGTQSALGLAA